MSPITNFANSSFAIGEFRADIRQLAKIILKIANKTIFLDHRICQLANFVAMFANY
jgi:hypothetical protein